MQHNQENCAALLRLWSFKNFFSDKKKDKICRMQVTLGSFLKPLYAFHRALMHKGPFLCSLCMHAEHLHTGTEEDISLYSYSLQIHLIHPEGQTRSIFFFLTF